MPIRHRIIKLAAVLLLLLGLTVGAGVAPASAASTCYYISPVHSGHFLCYDTAGAYALGVLRD